MILTANVLEFYSKFWLTLVFKKWKVAVSLHTGLICLNALIFHFIEWMFWLIWKCTDRFMFLIESAPIQTTQRLMNVCSIVYWKFSVINFINFFLLNVTFRKFPVLSFIHYKACQEELSEPDAFKIRHQCSFFRNMTLMF